MVIICPDAGIIHQADSPDDTTVGIVRGCCKYHLWDLSPDGDYMP